MVHLSSIVCNMHCRGRASGKMGKAAAVTCSVHKTHMMLQRTYVTASDNVLLAEILGSTSTASSATSTLSLGSALLCDMTACMVSQNQG